MTPIAFIAIIHDSAEKCEIEKGVPSGVTVAQAALESAWGESGLTEKANNLFGIKADKSWRGPTVIMPTRELLKGQWVTVRAPWRVYESWEASCLDHANYFHSNPRYAAALDNPHDAEKFATEVAKAGYATDNNYLKKLLSIIRGHNL